MVYALSFLVFFFSTSAQADFFTFGGDQGYKSKIPEQVEKLKGMEQSNNLEYEDAFNQAVKNIENSVEEEKLLCAGESADGAGKTIPKEQKQLCFRDLKNNYLEAMEVIFNLKKKYLGLIHARQIDQLTVIQKKLKADIDKNF